MSSSPFPAIRRADVYAYNFVLFGLWFVLDNAVTAFTNGVTASSAGGTALGVFSILAGVLAYRNIDNSERNERPAPTYLLALAGIETVLVAYLILDTLGRIG
ncbi:hypothetical protein [Haladaptatus sp. R4]|uniref:hypothetical protein n=1 Tax=Haladaptatus sp. R4 TaxID=1679489 RepID=UPI000AD1A0D1|nr:hypothetical protein [Haladaptatus sp. R4]